MALPESVAYIFTSSFTVLSILLWFPLNCSFQSCLAVFSVPPPSLSYPPLVNVLPSWTFLPAWNISSLTFWNKYCITLLELPYKRIPQPGWLKQQKRTVSQFWSLEAPGQGVCRLVSAEAALTSGRLLSVSSRGLSSTHMHPWCLSVCLNFFFL